MFKKKTPAAAWSCEMNSFEFFKENCGKSGIYFYLGVVFLGIFIVLFFLANDALDCLFSSTYRETYLIALAEFSLLILLLLGRKMIIWRAERRKRLSERAPLSQNELRAARSKLLGNRNYRRL
jgi:hypothetical protein